jgi:SnoaL-like domain
MLGCTEESVTSALKRARAVLQYRRERSADSEPPPPDSAQERALVRRFTQAYEAGDVHKLVALLTEDAWLIMPPVPARYQGRELAARFMAATAFRPGRSARLVPVRAKELTDGGRAAADTDIPAVGGLAGLRQRLGGAGVEEVKRGAAVAGRPAPMVW